MKDPSYSGIQVIDRAVSLLDAIARYDEPVSLKILAAETGLHSSTAYRILGSLLQADIVVRDANGHYALGNKLMHLGGRVRAGIDLEREALPIMEALRDEIGETVHLSVREGYEMVYVQRVASHHTIKAERIIGSRAPLHITAVGKMILGEKGREFCHRYAATSRLPAYTDNTLTAIWNLIEAVEQDVARGYALDNEEAELGVGCIGTVVRDSTGIAIAGLSVSAPIERRDEAWAPRVVDSANALSIRLGYNKSLAIR